MSFEYVICVVKLKKNEQNLSKVGDRYSKHHSYLDLKDNSIPSVKVRNCQQQKNSSTSLFSLKGEREGRKAETNCAVLCVL